MQRHGGPFHPPNLALYARPLDAPHQPGGRIFNAMILIITIIDYYLIIDFSITPCP